ncbi:MAG: DUF362 domain-containing protein [Gemmatimonadota bacterium]|jgi:uncharacterized protein (DUF362 family)
MTDRRTFVKVAAAAAVAPALARCQTRPEGPPPEPWTERAYRKAARSSVAVLAADAYDDRLIDIVGRGLDLFGVEAQDKRVVLKPNFVEFDPHGAINTNPALIAATIEAFRLRGAQEVVVAEGPGHRRDSEYIVTASGLHDVLRDTGARYVDLNGDAIRPVAAGSAYTRLGSLYLPATVLDADLFVSMPKLKTHHWAGTTLSLKNLFGIMPGSIYGWPKNVLHWQGIEPSILDINATLPVPRFNIVDGIIGMEGNGPIQGVPRRSGLLVFGTDPVAVDATAARLMGLEPAQVWYLSQADRFLGNAADDRIDQRGEDVVRLSQDYDVIPTMAHLKPGRSAAG